MKWLHLKTKNQNKTKGNAMKKDIICSSVIGICASYLPIFLWEGAVRAVGAFSISVIAFIILLHFEKEEENVL